MRSGPILRWPLSSNNASQHSIAMSLNTETSVQLVSLNNPALETTIANICDVRAKKDYRLAGTFVRGTELWLVFQRWV